MIDLTARPEPLRVPVGEVVARTSLVTPVPPHADPTATLVVVQRAVRIISDPPPAPLAGPTLIDELKLGLAEVSTSELDQVVERSLPERPGSEPSAQVVFASPGVFASPDGGMGVEPGQAASSSVGAPSYTSELGIPAALSPEHAALGLDADAGLERAVQAEQAHAADAGRERAPGADTEGAAGAGMEGVAEAIEAALLDSSRLRAEIEAPRESPLPPVPEPRAPGAPVQLEELAAAQGGGLDAAEPASAAGEISLAIEHELERLSDVPEAPVAEARPERTRTDSYADELSSDDVLSEEAHAADVELGGTVPPPAPPEALRRSVPSEGSAVRAGRPTERSERASGEFEELDVDAVAELRAEKEARAAARPQNLPPPPPVRSIQPEPEPLAKAQRLEEVRPSKPRPLSWWETFFDDDYLRTVRPPTREQVARQVDFIEKRLGLRPGASVLDVGCGLGLHALELSARGYAVVGLDLSLPMLTRAAEEAQARGARVNFLHGDVRDMTFDAAFDAVICLGTTFGYFDDDGNRRVLERLHRALKPGGALLIDVVNRDHVLTSQPNLVWFEGDGCVCMEETELNYFTSRLHVKRTVIHDNGKQTDNEYGVRLYALHELGQLLNLGGFRVVEVSGRMTVPGVFLGQESPNLLIVAQRRVAPEAGAVPNPEG